MNVTFDLAKRSKTLQERGLDFADAAAVFGGTTVEVEDTRKDYGSFCKRSEGTSTKRFLSEAFLYS